jgi:hypothetical protein|tara:strand:- start:3749 stop:4012 length:264 start_codon:yes stop_codon:yes gene_type:complete
MKANARKAFKELKNKGVHVLDPDRGWGGHFAISGELYGDGSEGDQPNKKLDYYEDFWGANTIIPDILDKHGLYFEWVNGGVAAVYDE